MEDGRNQQIYIFEISGFWPNFVLKQMITILFPNSTYNSISHWFYYEINVHLIPLDDSVSYSMFTFFLCACM